MTKIRIGLLAAALAACSSNSTPEPLQPADSIRAAEAASGSIGELGAPAKLENVSVTVTNPTVGGDESGPWLTITVHLENTTEEDQGLMSFAIYCSGNPESGGWQVGSTLEPTAGLPARSFDDGTLNLLLPGDSRTGKPRPTCATPAHLVAEGLSGDAIVWELADALIGAMNAEAQP